MKKSITYDDFDCEEAREASKLVDYYEDRQQGYVRRLLNEKRKDWDPRGINVQSRNLIKSIVDKSGLLFNAPPNLLVHPLGVDKGVKDTTFDRIMDRADWLQFFQNVDVYTRLLKTVVVLQLKHIPDERSTVGGSYRYDERRGDALLLRMLHRGNCVVRTDLTGNTVTELAYITKAPKLGLDPWEYRYISADAVEDWVVDGSTERRVKSVPNPDGIVPATPFYDVRVPVNKFWFNCPEDIVSFQDNYNLFLCDIQFAIAHQMQQTLATDSEIIQATGAASAVAQAVTDEKWTPPAAGNKSSIGGLGSIVYLQPGMTGQKPMFEFVGPNAPLDALHRIVQQQVKDIAADWDVTVKTQGDAAATSGFQVVVEEKHNLALREKRMQSMQAGLRAFYDVTQRLYPEMTEGTLKAEFAPPSLPVNRLENEQVWQYRFQNNVATPVDYLMREENLSYEQALEKALADAKLRRLLAAAGPQIQPAATQDPANPQQSGGNPRDPENTV